MELKDKDNFKKIISIVAFGIVLYFILQNLESARQIISNILNVLSPFLTGVGIAFVLNIPLRMFERKLFKPKKLKNGEIKQSKAKRPVCIILSIILLVAIISFVVKLVIPQLFSVIVMFAKNIPTWAYNLKEWALDMTRQYPNIRDQIQNININWEDIIKDKLSIAGSFVGSVVFSSIGFSVALIGGVFDTVISIVFAIYILNSKETLKLQIKKLIRAYFPTKRAEHILEICTLSENTFYNFLTGQCIEAVILGVLCFIGMTIFRFPYAATISVLIGVMNLIPIVGAFIGLIIGAILIVAISPIKALFFIIFILVLQQIEGNLIYPKVVGNSVGLPGMWVLVAVVVGGNVAGALGLLLGLPVISVLYTVLKNDVNSRLEHEKVKKSEENTQ